jgi:hypothetical protein
MDNPLPGIVKSADRTARRTLDTGGEIIKSVGQTARTTLGTVGELAGAFLSFLVPDGPKTPEQKEHQAAKTAHRREVEADQKVDLDHFLADRDHQLRQQDIEREAERDRQRGGRER